MDLVLGTGGMRMRPEGGFDFLLPTYMALAFLLAWAAVRLRPGVAAAVGFAGGTLWAWSAAAVGVVPAAAIALLLALLLGRIRRHHGRPHSPAA